jgi:hypothetical protein
MEGVAGSKRMPDQNSPTRDYVSPRPGSGPRLMRVQRWIVGTVFISFDKKIVKID